MSSNPIKRTYSRQNRAFIPSSPPSTLSSSPAPPSSKKRPLQKSLSSLDNIPPPAKRAKISDHAKTKTKVQPKQKTLTQLHFCIDQSIIRTCSVCDLSYTKGAPDDEALHRAHCSRVQKGMEWGKEEEKEVVKAGVRQVATGVRIKDGKKGRIICVKADVGGKIGSKLSTLLETINLSLSAPSLTPAILQASKVYLFLIPSTTSTTREKIIGCVVAQQIATAMAIASPSECSSMTPPDTNTFSSTLSSSQTEPETPPSSSPPTASLIAVDTTTGLFCHPAPLPTPLGIPRLFVPLAHRRQGVASKLLSAAAATFVHGCVLNPVKGQVAFTQPTGDGNALMRTWGGGGMRIYEE